MKKLFLTTAILLGMTIGAFAEWNPSADGFSFFNLFNINQNYDEQKEKEGLYSNDEVNALVWGDWIEVPSSNSLNYGQGGMFGRGKTLSTGIGFRNNFGLILPGNHGLSVDDNATPVGSGLLLLASMGVAYALKKRGEE